ncbi:hypothetical protein PVAP13_5NG350781 [Panicum virgatum]|uniref:Uncharacterized protein n=1 Tax=Panicum virgatum TaxID=38727 RepID=A0A8T0RVT7_PANVG|nr:hypothetical protein PVAP13_5NG350781 [Panicum virgatum]
MVERWASGQRRLCTVAAARSASRRSGANASCSRVEMEMLRNSAVASTPAAAEGPTSCTASRGTAPAFANSARMFG